MTFGVRVCVLVLWMAGIFWFSAQPGHASEVPSDALAEFVQQLGLPLPTELLAFAIRKGAHAFVYFMLGALTLGVFNPLLRSLRGAAWASVAWVFVYASSDELHQLLVPGRSGELRDVALDSVAGALGVLVVLFIYRLKRGSTGNEHAAAGVTVT
ncbi:VanZ family protein [Leucobacter exalbidus]|uniref:VanZ family protein n=1 Tax=Leucobacter exalbidus TaxID=662960 RepID=A0A940PTU0_9MICO|nr:VanZ family protein [Leucobacter exalbidus]